MVKIAGANCDQCPFRDGTLVPPKLATGQARLVIVGESPGREEVRTGQPFVGQSGQVLNSFLTGFGYSRDDVHITNACLCDPGFGDKEERIAHARECCRPRLLNELKQVGCDKIFTLGQVARDALIPDDVERGITMTARAGKRIQVVLNGHDGPGEALTAEVCPTFHPAYILRVPSMIIDTSRHWEQFHRPLLEDMTQSLTVHIVDTDQQLTECLATVFAAPVVAYDLETDGFDPRTNRILCVSLTSQDDVSWVITEDCTYRNADKIAHALTEYRGELVGHNFKFDAQFTLTQLGVMPQFAFDTLLADHALDERTWGHSLKDCVMREFELTTDYESVIHGVLKRMGLNVRTASYRNVPVDVLYPYAGYDTHYTFRLYPILLERLAREGRLLDLMTRVLVPAQHALALVELNGMFVDQEYTERLKSDHVREMAVCIRDSRRVSGNPSMNIGSPAQLERYLFDEKPQGLGLHRPDMKQGHAKGSKGRKSSVTGKEVLDALGDKLHPIIPIVKRYRKAQKRYGTYFTMPQDDDGRIRPDFNMAGTVTGRLSTKDLVNVPRGDIVRNMFCAPPGRVLISADYKQAELYLAANFSRDEFWCSIFKNDRDIHSEVAAMLFGPGYSKEDRMKAKNFNFGIVYSGLDYQAIAYNLNLPVRLVTDLGEKYMAVAFGLKKWIEETIQFVMTEQYVESHLGRRRRFPMINDWNRTAVKNEAVNFDCQSTASDLTLLSLVELTNSLWFGDSGGRVLNHLHDALICEVPETDWVAHARYIHQMMTTLPSQLMDLPIPMKVDISVGRSWGSLKDVDMQVLSEPESSH